MCATNHAHRILTRFVTINAVDALQLRKSTYNILFPKDDNLCSTAV
jgi:hypothetical protein